jgi:hypothetical protein
MVVGVGSVFMASIVVAAVAPTLRGWGADTQRGATPRLRMAERSGGLSEPTPEVHESGGSAWATAGRTAARLSIRR